MQPTELNLCEKWKPLPSQGRISATFFPDLGEVAQFQDEEYKRAIWEMRKIREQLGKQERGRKINYIIASPSLASLWSYPTETVLSNKIARNRIVLSF